MLKAYKYCLLPTDEQKQLLAQWFGACRFIYNIGLEVKMGVWASAQKNVTCFNLMRQATELRKEHDWLQAVPQQSLEAALNNQPINSNMEKTKEEILKFHIGKYYFESFPDVRMGSLAAMEEYATQRPCCMRWVKAAEVEPKESGYYFIKWPYNAEKAVLWFDLKIRERDGADAMCWTDGKNNYGSYELTSWLNESQSTPCPCTALREALLAAKELIGHFRLKKDVPTQKVWEQIEQALLSSGDAKEDDGWISVNDRLPEIPKTYTDENGDKLTPLNIKVLVWDGEFVYEKSFGIIEWEKDITHWRYLPTPPQTKEG